MSHDITRTIGAVRREITRIEHEGRPAYSIVAVRVYRADRADLWDALTNAERLRQWFLPVSGDLRVGGRYQFEGNAGGAIDICRAPEHLAVTWGMHGEESWLDLRLTEVADGRTELRLEHIAPIVPAEFWEKYGPGAVGIGWDQSVFSLERHLAGETIPPQKADEWLGSDEGKAFARHSGDAWYEATVGSGEDTTSARAAADRVIAAYTGEEAAESQGR